ncbi:MAG: type II toxin-antitoxin system VapC family toxin [Bacteroidales bacterium]|nr:type II toxin-antitoxin system VapC family toxin [Bacteroidales bacterium]
MKQRVYIDTSVIGGCFDQEFEEWSNRLFDDFRVGKKIAVISDITLDELSDAPQKVQDNFTTIPDDSLEILTSNPESRELADKYITEKAVSSKFYEDALHIAIATTNQVNVLASWNFKHIVNLDRIRMYNSVNLKNGFSILEIRTPREIL